MEDRRSIKKTRPRSGMPRCTLSTLLNTTPDKSGKQRRCVECQADGIFKVLRKAATRCARVYNQGARDDTDPGDVRDTEEVEPVASFIADVTGFNVDVSTMIVFDRAEGRYLLDEDVLLDAIGEMEDWVQDEGIDGLIGIRDMYKEYKAELQLPNLPKTRSFQEGHFLERHLDASGHSLKRYRQDA